MQMHDVIGLVAAFLTTISFLPQAIKTIRSRRTDGISVLMYSLFVIGVAIWLIYGLMIGSMPILIANGATLCLSLLIWFVAVRNLMTARRP